MQKFSNINNHNLLQTFYNLKEHQLFTKDKLMIHVTSNSDIIMYIEYTIDKHVEKASW